ncbi:PQQ-binding-like beta-propeller repeat protein [Natrinema sp. 74]|uniref:outer membrane protein assembly factor BamB family protein n=1 Tax=Natrinema sp. 74 TaxID=3384159 RepID=UPI0038D4B82E
MPSERSPRRDGDSRRDVTEQAAVAADQRWSTRRRALQAIGAAGAVAVAGCSNLVSFGGPSPDWRRTMSNASAASPPAVNDDVLLVGAQDKQLYAFDATNGDRAFTYETGGPITARPVASAGDGLAHVRSTDGDIYAVDTSGECLWSHEGSSQYGELATSGSLLVETGLESGDSSLRGFDAATGDVRFTSSTGRYRRSGLTAAGLALSVPAGSDRFRVAVLSLADGSVRWETDPHPSSVGIVADENLVVTSHDTTVTAYEIGDGTRQWKRTRNDVQSLVGPVLGAQVYLTYEAGDRAGILALDRATGAVRWQQPTGYQIRHIEPSADAIFVGSRVADPDGGTNGRLDCFESDGTRRWKTVSTVPDIENVALFEQTVLLAAERELVALDRSTGATKWTHEPKSASRFALVTAANSAYVSYLDDGAVAKFSLS